MRLSYILILLSLCFTHLAEAQNHIDYVGDWEGAIIHRDAFSIKVEIEVFQDKRALLTLSRDTVLSTSEISFAEDAPTGYEIADGLFFQAELYTHHDEQAAISGFMRSGMLLYHIHFKMVAKNYFVGTWNLLMVDTLKSPNVYLSVEHITGEGMALYPVFGDQRFSGTWCADFNMHGDTISFRDFKTGLGFKGTLANDIIAIDFKLAQFSLAKIKFKRSDGNWNTAHTDAEISISKNQSLQSLERAIGKDSLPNTHSILISRNGKMIYEQYFEGYHAGIPHDMRSASKSISSTITGIALDHNLIRSTDQYFYQFLPEKYQVIMDSAKRNITLHHLLTMSAGMDAVDFGTDRISLASEDQYQRSADWLTTVLKAPMLHAPGSKANYGSANPFLLGVVLDSAVSGNLEMYMDRFLFRPLRIHDYIIQTDLTGRPYFGGGMYITPRDMLKFGNLYLHKGAFENKQILSENWVSRSFEEYFQLGNTMDKNSYGYLWWHHLYDINGKSVRTIEARGAGGQYIILIPELESAVVITSGNFNSNKTQQPELILAHYILPFLLD